MPAQRFLMSYDTVLSFDAQKKKFGTRISRQKNVPKIEEEGLPKAVWPIIHYYDSVSTLISRFCRSAFSELPFARYHSLR